MKNKILVIEDDRAISELLCMNLEAAGYETVAAYDGEEAQRLLLWQEDFILEKVYMIMDMACFCLCWNINWRNAGSI